MGPPSPPQNSGAPSFTCGTPCCRPGIQVCHEMHPAAAAYLESRSPLQDPAAHSQVQQGAITSSTPRLRSLAHRIDARDNDFDDDDRFEFS